MIGTLDSANSSNIFRGNVTTNYGMDMTRSMCYATTGAVIRSTDGGHISTTQTSGTTNYTAPTAITTGSLTSTLSWDTMLRPTGEAGPNGDAVSIGYDSASRPATTTTPNGASVTYTYSTSPPQNTAIMNTDDTNTTGRKTVTRFDGLGRAIEVDSIDAAGVTQSIVQSQYAACGCSPMGKLSKTSRPYKPGDPIYWTTYNYDGLGRTLNVVAPDGASTTTYSYAGNTVTATDPAGNWKKFTMDAFGNLTTVVEPDASQTNTNNQATTTYTYDALNHLTNVSMPRRMPGGNVVTQTRTFNYLVGSSISAYLQSATNPESGTVTYAYNAGDGSLFSKTDAMNQTLKYARDSYGRVLTVSLAGSPDTVLRTYTYDTNSVDNTFSQYSNGRVTTVQYNVPAISNTTDGNGHEIDFTGDTVIEMYSYTSPGQVAAKRLRVTRTDTLNETLTADLNGAWTYNNEGKLKGVSYPGDPNGVYPPPTYSYSYDGMGRLAGMTETAPSTLTMLSGVTYNAAGQMTQMGGESRTYNVMGQLTNVHSGTFNITYNFSATQNNGKITSQVDNLMGEQVTYAYDSLNRLISAQAGSTWGQGFAYDPFGNLTDKTALAGSVPTLHIVPDASTNHLGGEDANGNSGGPTWDAENRMISTGTQRYAYDAQNKRVWSCTASGTYSWFPCTSETYYFYGPNGKLLAQFTPVYTLAYRDQQNVNHPATLTFQNSSNTRAYFGGRMLGDEDRLGSRGGKYFPYGDDRSSPLPVNDQVKFATYTRDSATGLDYADQRYYNSSYGRFASPDQYVSSGGPQDPGSWNRYSYTRGDPINRLDPAGLKDCAATVCLTVTEYLGIMLPGFSNSKAAPALVNIGDLGAETTLSGIGGGILVALEKAFFSQAQTAFQNAATFIAGQKTWSGDCERDLAALGATDAALSAGAGVVQFLDGVGSSATIASLYTSSAIQITGQLGQLLPGTVGSAIAANPLGLVAEAELGGTNIYLNSPLIVGLMGGSLQMAGGSVFDVTAVALHEILHNVTGLSDPDIQRSLGLPTGGATDNISQKLRTDCLQ